MRKTAKLLSVLLTICMILGAFPVVAFAGNAPEIVIEDADSTSKVVSRKNYAIAPGVTETDVIWNTKRGDAQSKGYVMEIDMANPEVSLMGSYMKLGATVKDGVYGTQVMSQQAAYAVEQGYNVVGAINTSLRFGSEEPIGMLVINGEVIHNELCSYGYFVVTKDGKAEIRSGRTPLDGSEYQAVSTFEQVLVVDGKNQYGEDHAQGSRAPRTAIGIKADGNVVLFVSDGRNVPTAVGQTMYELADVMVQLGCVSAINCDGGGSSTFITKREGSDELIIRNTPSDGSERATLDGLLVISNTASSGEFDHASVTPNEDYYTPGSTVELTATPVDASGAPADAIPEDVEWVIADEAMGTVTATGLGTASFVSSGVEGAALINLMQGDKVVGTATLNVVYPDSLAFNSDNVNLAYEQVTDLGLVAKFEGKDVIMKGDDIIWTVSDPAAGAFDGLMFTVTNDYLASIQATVTATFAANTALTCSTQINVGMQPSIVMDGGDGAEIDPLNYELGFGRVVARVNSPWGIGYWQRGTNDIDSPDYVDLITAHYTNNEGACSNASLWRGGEESAEYVTTDMDEWVDIIRFGNGAVKLNYDFSKANGIEGACLGFSHDIVLTGSPTGIGMWVYAPEGTANLWLRGAVGVEKDDGTFAYTFINYTERADTSWARGTGDVGGINWTGWHYVEADLRAYAGQAIRVLAGETVRVMFTNGKYGPTINGTITGMGDLTADATIIPRAECQGWILIDNLQFVYGVNNQDVTAPEISSVVWSDGDGEKTEMIDGTVVSTNTPTFRFDFDDKEYEDRYATGVVTELFYIDDVMYGSGTVVASEGYTFDTFTLSNGQHTLTCYIKDDFGNVTKKSFSFIVSGSDDTLPQFTFEYPDSIGLDSVFELAVKCSASDLAGADALTSVINYNKNYTVEDVVFDDAFDGTWTAKNGVLTINAAPVAETAGETFFTVKIAVPANAVKGASFDFRVQNVILTMSSGTVSNSTATVYVPITARYNLTADTLIVGHEAVLTVTDADGAPVADANIYMNGTLIGTTGEDGTLTTSAVTAAAGSFTLYAAVEKTASYTYSVQVTRPDGSAVANTEIRDAEGNTIGTTDENGWLNVPAFNEMTAGWTSSETDANGFSFAETFTAFTPYGENAPFNILMNMPLDSKTMQNITWMVNPDAAEAVAMMRVAASEDMADAMIFSGVCTPLVFAVDGLSAYGCSVTADGLTAGTTYYFQVGDGYIWSEVGTFTTAAEKDYTAFFAIGDMQGDDAKAVAQFSALMEDEDFEYDFGAQLGDAIDNVGNISEWEALLGIFGADIFSKTDMLHVIGNHEVFGDEKAISALTLFGTPVENPSDYYSFEVGNVYVATMGYTLDRDIMQDALDWLLEDASKTECEWKVLMMHVPTCYTNAEQTDSAFYAEELPAVAEAAGINFVVSGHDHAYARTGSKNGVVYLIAGTAGEKKYFCADNGFDWDIATQDYDSIYVSFYATDTVLRMTAYNVDASGNKTVFDEYTFSNAPCEDHEYHLNAKTGKLVCAKCLSEYEGTLDEYSGLYYDGDELHYILLGKGMTGWVNVNDEYYYFDETTGAAVDGQQTIKGYGYTFRDNILVDGTWFKDNLGYLYLMWAGSKHPSGFATINGKTYCFKTTLRAAYTGYSNVTLGIGTESKWYWFDDNGVLISELTDGIYGPNEHGEYIQMQNGKPYGTGLMEMDGFTYYFSTSGKSVAGRMQFVPSKNLNGLAEKPGYYIFDELGHLVDGPVIPEDGYIELGKWVYGKTITVATANLNKPLAVADDARSAYVEAGDFSTDDLTLINLPEFDRYTSARVILLDAAGNMLAYSAPFTAGEDMAINNLSYVGQKTNAVSCILSVTLCGNIANAEAAFEVVAGMPVPVETEPATEPEVTEPEVTEPEVTEPEVTEPEVTEPEVTEPEVTEPEVTEPEVTEPEVTEPEVTEPEVTEPEETEPATEPEETEPATEPEETEPATEPEETEPATEPEETEPATEPEETEEPEEPADNWVYGQKMTYGVAYVRRAPVYAEDAKCAYVKPAEYTADVDITVNVPRFDKFTMFRVLLLDAKGNVIAYSADKKADTDIVINNLAYAGTKNGAVSYMLTVTLCGNAADAEAAFEQISGGLVTK